MPDGTTRFLVDHERLLNVTQELGGSLLDPLKSTVVHEQRSMGTWVVRKRPPNAGGEPLHSAPRA
jgi:hypothetical protein